MANETKRPNARLLKKAIEKLSEFDGVEDGEWTAKSVRDYGAEVIADVFDVPLMQVEAAIDAVRADRQAKAALAELLAGKAVR